MCDVSSKAKYALLAQITTRLCFSVCYFEVLHLLRTGLLCKDAFAEPLPHPHGSWAYVMVPCVSKYCNHGTPFDAEIFNAKSGQVHA